LRANRLGHAGYAHRTIGHGGRRRRRRRDRRARAICFGLRLAEQGLAVFLGDRALRDQQADQVGHGIGRRRGRLRGRRSSGLRGFGRSG